MERSTEKYLNENVKENEKYLQYQNIANNYKADVVHMSQTLGRCHACNSDIFDWTKSSSKKYYCEKFDDDVKIAYIQV